MNLRNFFMSEALKPFEIESHPKTTMAWGAALLLIAILSIFLNAPIGFPIAFGILGFCCLFSYTTVIAPAKERFLSSAVFLGDGSCSRNVEFHSVPFSPSQFRESRTNRTELMLITWACGLKRRATSY